MAVRIYLVDSHPAFMAAASSFLSQLPEVMVVGQSYACEETMDAIAELHPDLVLLDIDHPFNAMRLGQHLMLDVHPPFMALLSMHERGQHLDMPPMGQGITFVNKWDFVNAIVPVIESVAAQSALA
jgi:DNA-binding NarL/FixJ family response regulator